MKDVNHQILVEKLATKLSDVAVQPSWAEFVKTGHGKQRPPTRRDWWQVRAAAVLLSVEKLGPVGVSKLRTKYGTRKNRGYKPEKHADGSGNILRKILQQLELGEVLKQETKGVHKGRVVTKKGQRLIIDASKEAKVEEAKKPKVEKPSKKEDKPEIKTEQKKVKPAQKAKKKKD